MNAIVAVNKDWGIGCGGTQSIVIPEDRRRFKTLTEGGAVIAGRKTFSDFGKPLPGRKNIILTNDPEFTADGAIIAHSVGDILAGIAGIPPEKVFVIGGESVYSLLLPLCDYAYVTRIDAEPESDTFFPNLDELPEWSVAEEGERTGYSMTWKNQATVIGYTFVRYRRERANPTRFA